jgi:hypothetical protein
MAKTGLTVILLASAILGLACSSAQMQTEVPASDKPPVVDTLRTLFEELQQAMLLGDQTQFFSLLDPVQADSLQKLVRRHGYTSLKTYIERRFAYWPNLDTMELYEVKASGDYIRLTYAAPGTSFGYREPRVRYTFLLFRRVSGEWKMAAATGLECPRYDPYGYGYPVTVHETDLPAKLRFPRAF